MVCKKIQLDTERLVSLLVKDDNTEKKRTIMNLNNQERKELVTYLLYGVKE